MKYKIIILSLLFSMASFAEETAKSEFQLTNESELGIVVTGGNTQTQTISLKELASYVFDKNVFKFNANFLKASNNGIEQAYRWGLGLRYERELSDMVSAFLGQNIESDKFQDILQRYNTDLGGKYYFYKAAELNWFAELGYRFTRVNFTTRFRNDNFIRIYTEAERFFSKSVSTKLWIEYLPNITVGKAYRISGELSLSAALNSVFSVKSGYLLRYDNSPVPGVVFKTDSTFTTALVAKF